MLTKVYPKHNWLPWKFKRTPNFFWKETRNQRSFLLWATKQLGIPDAKDWYSLTPKVTMVTKKEF
jgi:hypothetical protein